MLNRRQFVHTAGASLAAVPFLPNISLAQDKSVLSAGNIYKVIYDERLPESVLFAEQAERMGLEIAAVGDDITNVWANDLYYKWKDGPAAIAGLTLESTAFMFEMLSRDTWMVPAFKARHKAGPEGISHELTSSPDTLAMSPILSEMGDNWATGVASIACQLGECLPGRTETSITSVGVAAHQDQDLVSWVFAPLRRNT